MLTSESRSKIILRDLLCNRGRVSAVLMLGEITEWLRLVKGWRPMGRGSKQLISRHLVGEGQPKHSTPWSVFSEQAANRDLD